MGENILSRVCRNDGELLFSLGGYDAFSLRLVITHNILIDMLVWQQHDVSMSLGGYIGAFFLIVWW
jgi:hypothetical protein